MGVEADAGALRVEPKWAVDGVCGWEVRTFIIRLRRDGQQADPIEGVKGAHPEKMLDIFAVSCSLSSDCWALGPADCWPERQLTIDELDE